MSNDSELASWVECPTYDQTTAWHRKEVVSMGGTGKKQGKLRTCKTSSSFLLELQHLWHGQKERAKGFKDLTRVTHHLNSHSVNRRSKANRQHWSN